MKTAITIRLDPDQQTMLKKEAEEEKTSVSEIIRRKISNKTSSDSFFSFMERIESKLDGLAREVRNG